MAAKEKSYVIKVPVYTTEIIDGADDMFGGINYGNMISFLKKKIDFFNEHSGKLEFDNRNKTRRTVINELKYTIHPMGSGNSGFLLQISAYGTNLYDGYFEAEEKIKFEKDSRIGSETNFIMIYPVIKGLISSKYNTYYIILVYEDPTKNSDEIIKITKTVLNKVLNIPIANIKLPTILDELKVVGNIPELCMKYSAVYNDGNEVDVKYREYLVGGKFKKQKEDHFKNMPIDKVEELINEEEKEGYHKKEAKILVGKKEYRISKEIKEAGEVIRETAEKIFNAKTAITQKELDNKIHDKEFIISKLLPILENFLSVDDDR